MPLAVVIVAVEGSANIHVLQTDPAAVSKTVV